TTGSRARPPAARRMVGGAGSFSAGGAGRPRMRGQRAVNENRTRQPTGRTAHPLPPPSAPRTIPEGSSGSKYARSAPGATRRPGGSYRRDLLSWRRDDVGARTAMRRDSLGGRMDSLAFLDNVTKAKPQPVYAVYGDEAFLKRRVLLALRALVLGP